MLRCREGGVGGGGARYRKDSRGKERARKRERGSIASSSSVTPPFIQTDVVAGFAPLKVSAHPVLPSVCLSLGSTPPGWIKTDS